MKECEVCKRQNAEVHHIIFRSQNKHMKNIEINLKYLCREHHTGGSGVHMNREIDLKYKRELQAKLFELFNIDHYYTVEEVEEKLNITSSLASKITKHLKLYKSGYLGEDIVRGLLGGRLYE